MKEKAIVKKTGEILDVKYRWIVKKMSISINIPEGLEDKLEKFIGEFEYKDTNVEEGDNFELSDGKKYTSDELIVGLDNIRDYKINQVEE